MRDRKSPQKTFRCVVYTRKSSEEGLEQDFNSLQAQREDPCEAFINSQKHEGWVLLPAVYDDAGYSGGSMDRPALRQLLQDVQSGSVDVVVVYKVDRLTRSLADFAKIVEVFDAAAVSFVSVTQQFNTTTSMGRLTLNVLLSFAQFEREVTGERIRDKIAASKKKGMWMGGWVPLGYERKDRTLVVNEKEAKTVRTIFDLFLRLKNVRQVQSELARLGLKTKPYAVKRGRATGNLPFARHIYRILSNPLYIGEIDHKGLRHPGQHPALISQDRWDAVQAQLGANRHAKRAASNTGSTNLLRGLLYDQSDNSLVSSYTTKNGKRYRYYVVSDGPGRHPRDPNGGKARLSAAQVDGLVCSSLRNFLTGKRELVSYLRARSWNATEIATALETASRLADNLASASPENKRAILTGLVSRVLASQNQLHINIRVDGLASAGRSPEDFRGDKADLSIKIPFDAMRDTGPVRLLIEGRTNQQPDPVVIKAVARAHRWFDDLITAKARSMTEIAARENLTDNYVSNLIHLAWLPPKMVESILDGHLRATMAARKSMIDRSIDPVWAETTDDVY